MTTAPDLPEAVASELKALRALVATVLQKVASVELLARTMTSQYTYIMGRVDDIREITARTDATVEAWRIRELREAKEIADAEYMAELGRAEGDKRETRLTDDTLPPPAESNGNGEHGE